MDLGLGGKVAIVTAASKGIGKAIAEELAGEGASVSICAREEKELREAEADIRRGGAGVLTVPADVTDVGDVRKVVDETAREFGRVDILVNNAGVVVPYNSVDTTERSGATRWIST